MAEVFDIQDDVSKAIVQALKVKWIDARSESKVERHTDDLDAYHSYLQGRYYWYRRDRGGLQQALGYFEQALKHDPSYAPAHAGLSETYMIRYEGESPIHRARFCHGSYNPPRLLKD